VSQISEKTGITESRSKLKLDPNVPARVHRVHRLDHVGEEYYLVIFGEPQASVGVAVVDSVTGEVLIYATLPGTREHLSIDSKKALLYASIPEGAHVRLVWKPFRGSRSPLYPVWEISYKGKVTYVDQQGSTWDSLNEMHA
jgi:hypothetical protein